MRKKLLVILLFLPSIIFAKLTVGVTMLPYYSYVTNIVGDKMNVVSIVPENINAHNYDPSYEDLTRLKDVDILVVNGIGHDEYAYKMLDALNDPKIKVINANENVGLMKASGTSIDQVNMHTFISISRSIEQVNQIARKLGSIDKKNRIFYLKNASQYNKKLRLMLIEAKKKLKNVDLYNIKISTTHAGYDYLLADFGLTVSVVIEPSVIHSPSAVDLKNAIELIKKEKINILFDEATSNHNNANLIKNETGIYVATLYHLTSGKYTKDNFEKFIKKNLDSVVDALLDINGRK
ncbi:metal ABC transporter solute-binding protein, Zn/Mn family [Oceanivirga miroungae]|uniref:Lipoprotein promoting cell invasion n=1 Tax=Oceanivirga miroungae TaxID=1130046 RepID=A0A6I8M7K3_9FUSO|nr:zinc ABC transporter substrate-binding protein [Oceanivirga miroungae]VWL85406.1 lipoprotein promoting cell invasion [Oceanivirga miroungae]